jgi:lysophospholipase L1-like esterase
MRRSRMRRSRMHRFLLKLARVSPLILLAGLIGLEAQSSLASRWVQQHSPEPIAPQLAAIANSPTPQLTESQPSPNATGTLKPDPLVSQQSWQDDLGDRVAVAQGQTYGHCVFGDSISSGLGNTLGDTTSNFAMGGMSSVSLVEQMNQLQAGGTRCKQVILAIGTNDAVYQITDDEFMQNMKQAIALARQMDATQIIVLPAFYSTIPASRNIAMAGPIERVQAISRLLQQVAQQEQAIFTADGIEVLYKGQALRDDLTSDGVHLNASGRVLYRNILLKLIATSAG